jgi:hypothetical protein
MQLEPCINIVKAKVLLFSRWELVSLSRALGLGQLTGPVPFGHRASLKVHPLVPFMGCRAVQFFVIVLDRSVGAGLSHGPHS